MEPDGDGNGNWSLDSTRLDDVAPPMASASQDNRDYDAELSALLIPAADTQQQPQFHQSRTPRVERGGGGGGHVWDLDMDLSSVHTMNQHQHLHSNSETPPEQSGGFGTNADNDMAAMVLPFPEASCCGLNSPYAHAGTVTTNRRSISTISTPYRRPCQCLRIMAQFLESMDTQGAGSDSDAEEIGVDMFLISLGRGMRTCEEVLACEQCNACAENGIIIATLAQQLGSAAESAARKLITHGRQLQLAASSPHSHSRNSNQMAGDEVLDGSISFGRCNSMSLVSLRRL